jgi:hypothetical protein
MNIYKYKYIYIIEECTANNANSNKNGKKKCCSLSSTSLDGVTCDEAWGVDILVPQSRLRSQVLKQAQRSS